MTVGELNACDEAGLRKLFTWQARFRIAPKFGSRPIGWYQCEHIEKANALYNLAKKRGYADSAKLTVSGGQIHADRFYIIGVAQLRNYSLEAY